MPFLPVELFLVSYLQLFGSWIKSVIKMNRSKNYFHDLKIVKKKKRGRKSKMKILHSCFHGLKKLKTTLLLMPRIQIEKKIF